MRNGINDLINAISGRHLYINYDDKRLFTFLFRATGSPINRASIKGALLMEI